jgi:hypothetical protein
MRTVCAGPVALGLVETRGGRAGAETCGAMLRAGGDGLCRVTSGTVTNRHTACWRVRVAKDDGEPLAQSIGGQTAAEHGGLLLGPGALGDRNEIGKR